MSKYQVKIKEPFNLREYCITVEDNQISKIVLDKDQTVGNKLWAVAYDMHWKTTVLRSDYIPHLYAGFLSVLLVSFALTVFVLFRESKKIIELILDRYLKLKELKHGTTKPTHLD